MGDRESGVQGGEGALGVESRGQDGEWGSQAVA